MIEFPEDELNDIEILITERDEMQDKLDGDDETLKNLRIDNKEKQREIGEFRKKHEQLRILRAGYETNVKNKDKQVRNEIQRKGGTEKREEKLTKVKKDLKNSNKELKATVDSLDQKSKSRRSNVKRAKTNQNRAKSDYDEIKTKLTRMTYEAEKIGDDNIHEKLHELTTLHRDISQHLDRFRTQAFARRDLLKRIKLKISESTFSDTKPIREKVSDWLYAVTEGKWRRVEMEGNLEIKEIQGPQGKLLPGEHYGSHGLQQVIHGLIRLAVATHIYEKGKKHNPDFPPVSLVMDESQGHVDDNRVKLLMERFNTAIKDGQVQVIALSHRESEFRSLNPVIEYRVDKRLLFGIDEEE